MILEQQLENIAPYDRQKKITALLLIFLIILAVVAVGLYLQNSKVNQELKRTQEQYNLIKTSPDYSYIDWFNWPTYENNYFSFDYRPDLNIEEIDEKNWIDLNYYPSNQKSYESEFCLLIKIINNEQNYSLKEYAERELCAMANEDNREFCVDIVKNNLKDFSYHHNDSESGLIKGIETVFNLYEHPVHVHLIENKENIVSFGLSGCNTGEGPTDFAEFTKKRIISSFKFKN